MAHSSSIKLLLAQLALTTVLVCPLSGALASSFEVKSEKVESRALRLPKIDIDTVDYSKVQFEYAVAGKVKISNQKEGGEILTCDGEKRKNKFLKISYIGPKVLFRVMDYREDYVMHSDRINTDGQAYYGQNDCNNEGDLYANFKRDQKKWLKELNKQAIQNAIKEMEAFIANDTAPVFENFYFSVFYISSESSEFQKFDDAYKLFLTALDRNRRIGPNFNAQEEYVQVADIWERELKRVENKGKAYEDVVLALHRNLSSLYFFSTDYKKALKHEELALKLGMPTMDSRKEKILEYQSRAAHSPRASGSIVRQLKAWRSGDDIIRFRKLKEVEYKTLQDRAVGLR